MCQWPGVIFWGLISSYMDFTKNSNMEQLEEHKAGTKSEYSVTWTYIQSVPSHICHCRIVIKPTVRWNSQAIPTKPGISFHNPLCRCMVGGFTCDCAPCVVSSASIDVSSLHALGTNSWVAVAAAAVLSQVHLTDTHTQTMDLNKKHELKNYKYNATTFSLGQLLTESKTQY